MVSVGVLGVVFTRNLLVLLSLVTLQSVLGQRYLARAEFGVSFVLLCRLGMQRWSHCVWNRMIRNVMYGADPLLFLLDGIPRTRLHPASPHNTT
jgi:hypothetical protein